MQKTLENNGESGAQKSSVPVVVFFPAIKPFRLSQVTEGVFGGLVPTKCQNCKEYTCRATCMEERPSKVSVDIGGKITWVITPSYSLKRHLSMIAVPKMLKCYDCDTTLNRQELSCDCVPGPQDLNPSLVGPHLGQRMQREAYCRNRHMSCHTALEYCSQPLSDIWSQPGVSQPFCLFCDEHKVNRMLCEREMVSLPSTAGDE